ncbi:MAG TPA: GNAT family N-acetyltransferase [Nocardioidaceae bacterium]|nr:GNAT family N-acetyltransferase [Nocardioidaceae bacterium]
MEIAEFTPDDVATVSEVVELANAVGKVDSPWVHPDTAARYAMMMRHGWDGEPPRCFAARDRGRLVGAAELSVSEWDNTHLAWAGLSVHPDERRRGHGSALFGFLTEEATRVGRRSIGLDGWESPATLGFAARHRLPQRSAAINRRQHLDEVTRETLDRLYDDARAAASSYDLVGISGPTPPDLLDAVAGMTVAINDAPTDDLDIEDEVFPVERIVAYERAQQAQGHRMYRLLARHRDTGELAGHTVVVVEAERPTIGDQHDTSVVRAHRGHRLGMLLKAGMLRWLLDEEPQLETVYTWNAESNDHMIDVNDKLGYRVMGRALQFQRDI